MNTQVNWEKLRNELQRLADVESLKEEVQRIGSEIRNFDFHTVLTPGAKEKVKTFEKRYGELMRTIQQAQRQMDREFNRILRQIKSRRSDVGKAVNQQKERLEKLSTELKKRFYTAKAVKPSAAARRKGTVKSTSKKTATKNRKKS